MQRYRVVTKSFIAGEAVYLKGDVISDADAGMTLAPFVGLKLIEKYDDPDTIVAPPMEQPSLLVKIRRAFTIH